MLKIALCDDVAIQLNMLEDMVNSYVFDSGIDAEIKSFGSGEALLEYVDKNSFFDIYILDMIMPGIKGIELGLELRNRKDNGKIIYLTATSEYAVESYQVAAFFYLLKPLSKKNIYEVLNKARAEITRQEIAAMDYKDGMEHYEIKSRDGKIMVRVGDIDYVDIVNRAPNYHMSDGSIIECVMLRGPFIESIKLLADKDIMFLASNNLLINIANVELVDKNQVSFRGGQVFYPSKKATAAIYQKIMK